MHQNIYLNSSILKDFREFYKQILLLQDMALDSGSSQSSHSNEANSDSDQNYQTLNHKIQTRLEALLLHQYENVGAQKGGYAAHYYRQAQYIMVALADEIFINLNWHGKEEWKDHLLESLIYNTQDSGDKFFENLDQFLQTEGHQATDMASLYLIALGLGFKGKYRGTPQESKLFAYREKLYNYIAKENPSLLEKKSPFFPQAYENILESRQNAEMPDTKPWWISLGIIILAFIGISSLIWITHISSFSPFINTLEKWANI